jgi:kynurenine formamidase
LQLDSFIGEAAVLDVSKTTGGITDADLDACSALVRAGDILLLYTGTSENWGKGGSVSDFSYLDLSATRWVIDHGLKCVGIDSPSIEKYGSKGGLVHKKLLSRGVGIIENLSSKLKKFAGSRMFLVCLPCSWKGRTRHRLVPSFSRCSNNC